MAREMKSKRARKHVLSTALRDYLRRRKDEAANEQLRRMAGAAGIGLGLVYMTPEERQAVLKLRSKKL